MSVGVWVSVGVCVCVHGEGGIIIAINREKENAYEGKSYMHTNYTYRLLKKMCG